MAFPLRAGRIAFLVSVVAWLGAACHPGGARPAANAVKATANAADFHHSDPTTIGATGRPQLLEFFGPT